MTTDKLVTIDDSALTAITGGRADPPRLFGPTAFRAVPGPVKHAGSKPSGETAPNPPHLRPGFPYATESRL
jgi:hypothetical protein